MLGLLGQFRYEAAIPVLEKLAKENPDWTDVQLDYAIACSHVDGEKMGKDGGDVPDLVVALGCVACWSGSRRTSAPTTYSA